MAGETMAGRLIRKQSQLEERGVPDGALKNDGTLDKDNMIIQLNKMRERILEDLRKEGIFNMKKALDKTMTDKVDFDTFAFEIDEIKALLLGPNAPKLGKGSKVKSIGEAIALTDKIPALESLTEKIAA